MIADYLRERSWRRAVSQYLQVLIADAEISGIDLEAAESLLMQ
jgi:peptidyl-prolyl cis-trans isomerase C